MEPSYQNKWTMISTKNGFLSMFNLNKCFNVYNYKSMLQIKSMLYCKYLKRDMEKNKCTIFLYVYFYKNNS
jgi:hypothetical protein